MLKTNIQNFCADTPNYSEKCKKVYITALHLHHGGVEMVISSLANALAEKGRDVEVLCIYRLGEPAYFFDNRVKITYLTDVHPNRDEFKEAIRSKNPLRIIKEAFYALRVLRLKKQVIKDAVEKIECGAVISTRNEHSVLLSKYGRKGVLKIAQLHSDHNFEKKLLNDFKFKYKNIDYFTLLTPQTTEEIKEVLRGHNEKTKCITVPNFLPELPSFQRGEVKKQVISVGRLSPEKGFLRLLDSWALFLKEHSDWKLLLVGDGAQRWALEEKAHSLGISSSVVFTGMLSHNEVLSQMASSAVYAMPSYTEALPMVILEAASCALPAVAFDVRVGPRALIENGKTGILVPDCDTAEFAAALSLLADKEKLRDSMGKNAQIHAKDYEKEKVVGIWEQLLDRSI